MVINDFVDLKGSYDIVSNLEYIVFAGRDLWICRKDQKVIHQRKDVVNASPVAFLSGNRLLLSGGKKTAYRLVSLENGNDEWIISSVGKVEYFSGTVAVSPDESTAYDYYVWHERDYFVKIDLEGGSFETHEIHRSDHSAISDIVCDRDGMPCLLRTRYYDIEGKKFSMNGIQYLEKDQFTPGTDYYWKSMWFYKGSEISKQFLDGTDFVVTDNFNVYETRTGEILFLLDPCSKFVVREKNPIRYYFDPTRHFLTALYNDCNIVIDWIHKKIIARYEAPFLKGCIVGNEYWIFPNEGLKRMPFPFIEDK